MRWHPLYIKWSLYLKHLSSKAYETLRKSGCISLPSKRTLQDYTQCISTSIGFSAEIDNCLFNAADITNNPLNRYVTLVMDEVHIKEDLVFDKYQGHLIGLVDLGNTNKTARI